MSTSPQSEDKYVIAQANAPLNEYGEFVHRNSCRYHSTFAIYDYEYIDYMDVAPNQVVGISAALIPFLEHDDANRALMGSNMQTQAVPFAAPRSPVGLDRHGDGCRSRLWPGDRRRRRWRGRQGDRR